MSCVSIMLSVLRFTTSDYHLVIFKHLAIVLSDHWLRLLITPLVFSTFSSDCYNIRLIRYQPYMYIYLRAKNVSTEGNALATAKNVHLSIILGKNVAPLSTNIKALSINIKILSTDINALSTNIKTLFIAMNGYVNIIPTGNLVYRNTT